MKELINEWLLLDAQIMNRCVRGRDLAALINKKRKLGERILETEKVNATETNQSR